MMVWRRQRHNPLGVTLPALPEKHQAVPSHLSPSQNQPQSLLPRDLSLSSLTPFPNPRPPSPQAPVAEQEWHYPDPSHLLAQDSQIPEPFTAQVWLGAGLAASMLIGAIARYRGRRNRHYRRADVDAA